MNSAVSPFLYPAKWAGSVPVVKVWFQRAHSLPYCKCLTNLAGHVVQHGLTLAADGGRSPAEPVILAEVSSAYRWWVVHSPGFTCREGCQKVTIAPLHWWKYDTHLHKIRYHDGLSRFSPIYIDILWRSIRIIIYTKLLCRQLLFVRTDVAFWRFIVKKMFFVSILRNRFEDIC